MRYFFITAALLAASLSSVLAQAQGRVLTLEECRSMALQSNKNMQIRDAETRAADYTRRQARAAYLPALDVTAGYLYNQKDMSVISEDAYLPVKSFDLASQSYQFDVVKNPMTGEPVMVNGQPIPSQIALLPKDALTFDVHNVFAGAVTLTQPLFMGGKIRSLNKLAEAGKRAAEALRENEADNIIYNVDAAYWQVVSLKAKEALALSYVAMLDTLHSDVSHMIEQGVATRSDLLSVDVKLNQANVDLTKVQNGLSLSRMALAQKCGMPIDEQFLLADEGKSELQDLYPTTSEAVNMQQVYASRSDLRALDAAINASSAEKDVAMASMLPNLALVGSYSFCTPNMFNGFENRVRGMFSVGVMATIPLWHWGGNYYKYKAAKVKEEIARLTLDDARSLVDLQVNQARFKMDEAVKTQQMTHSNMAKADENLRCAKLAFREGMSTTELIMEAQTAWLKAASERVDADIDVRLCHVYLDKVLGRLN